MALMCERLDVLLHLFVAIFTPLCNLSNKFYCPRLVLKQTDAWAASHLYYCPCSGITHKGCCHHVGVLLPAATATAAASTPNAAAPNLPV
jgi:hypothetical protein